MLQTWICEKCRKDMGENLEVSHILPDRKHPDVKQIRCTRGRRQGKKRCTTLPLRHTSCQGRGGSWVRTGLDRLDRHLHSQCHWLRVIPNWHESSGSTLFTSKEGSHIHSTQQPLHVWLYIITTIITYMRVVGLGLCLSLR